MNAKNTPPRAALLVMASSAVFSFDQPVITIGRASENDLVIDKSNVSRKHAELRYQDGEFEIVDLDSTGGTFVNGNKIDSFKLSNGDVITLANVHLVFGQDEFPVAESTTKYEIPKDASQASNETTIIFRGDRKQ